ncbi:type II toxin-antitoxin system VapC family toxin (plasmid) [Synechocystis sp. B12]|jgi:PIN domain nuclease of toxin-antitoxin system|nr:type II toxin-antitoxin system VapC family toxin [Synechocystis sp. B12]
MILLDTHTFLWFILDDPQLSPQGDRIISDRANTIAISPASYWEIAIKISIGKYSLPESYDTFIEREIATNDFCILPILPKHTSALINLPFHHKDPFDRLLIAQAITENIPIISNDSILDKYSVHRIW